MYLAQKGAFYIVRKTGFKDESLEKSRETIDFFQSILAISDIKQIKEEFNDEFLRGLYEHVKEISKTAFAPISKAAYACSLVFEKDKQFLIHSGSNIDPGKKENFKLPKFRNCAERQASLSALEVDRLENNSVKIMVLFRLDNKVKKLNAQKLLPCKDCHEKYLLDLKKNNGCLLIISEEMESHDFLKSSSIQKHELVINDEFRLILFKGDELNDLNLEPELGASIKPD